jgi:hypothetical protein
MGKERGATGGTARIETEKSPRTGNEWSFVLLLDLGVIPPVCMGSYSTDYGKYICTQCYQYLDALIVVDWRGRKHLDWDVRGTLTRYQYSVECTDKQ